MRGAPLFFTLARVYSYFDSKVGHLTAPSFDLLVNLLQATRCSLCLSGSDYRTASEDVSEYIGVSASCYKQKSIPSKRRCKPDPCCERGASAYEVAQMNGFSGSAIEWLDSLKGQDGAAGPVGPDGPQGEQGPQGPPGGGSSEWGGITGILSEQEDLQDELDMRASLSGNNLFSGENIFALEENNNFRVQTTGTGNVTIASVDNGDVLISASGGGLVRIISASLGAMNNITIGSNVPADGSFNKLRTIPGTLASIGSAATAGAGTIRFITDSQDMHLGNSGVLAVGGGSEFAPVYSNGSNWVIL